MNRVQFFYFVQFGRFVTTNFYYFHVVLFVVVWCIFSKVNINLKCLRCLSCHLKKEIMVDRDFASLTLCRCHCRCYFNCNALTRPYLFAYLCMISALLLPFLLIFSPSFLPFLFVDCSAIRRHDGYIGCSRTTII